MSSSYSNIREAERYEEPMMKKTFAMTVLCCVLCLCGCGNASSGTGETSAASSFETTQDTAVAVSGTAAAAVDTQNLDSNDVAAFDEYTAKIESVKLHADGTLSVGFTFTNLGTTAMYMYESFAVSAMQDGKTLRDVTDINDGSAGEKAVLTEVKNGESVLCTYTFEGASKGDVMIDICEPTADQTLLIGHLYRIDSFSN